MKTLGTPLDAEVVDELKAMGRRGAETKDLAAFIRATFGLHGDMHVPIFAYLGRAFPVSLRVLLPMREEGFDGHYARAIQVAFWVLTCLNDKFDATLGGRQFSAWTPVTWQRTDSATLEYCLHPDATMPSELFGRGVFQQRVDKQEAFEPSKAEIRQRIMAFVSDLARMIEHGQNGYEGASNNLASLNFEVEIKDEGPAYRVICVVRVIKDLSMQTQLPALQPIA